MSKPAATLGSNHVCPMVTGVVPHVGGPVIMGSPNVFFGGKPAARMGDMCTCAGPPDTIIQGNPMVLVNGMPVACMGDMTAHGGTIIMGEMNILIGTKPPQPGAGAAPVTIGAIDIKKTEVTPLAFTPAEMIDFPKITAMDKIKATLAGHGKTLKEAEKKQEEAKKRGYLIDLDFSI